MTFEAINWIGITIAVIVSMGIGAGWYTFLAKPWIAANGFSDEQVKHIEDNDSPWIYAVAAFCHLIMALILSNVIYYFGSGTPSIVVGISAAFWCWLGFIVTSMTVNHRFQFKPWSLTAIDAGHYFLVIMAQGIILGWMGS